MTDRGKLQAPNFALGTVERSLQYTLEKFRLISGVERR